MATRDDRLSHLALPLIIQESLLPRTQERPSFIENMEIQTFPCLVESSKGKRLPLPSGIISRRLLYWAITTARYNKSPEIICDGSPTFLKNLNLGATARRESVISRHNSRDWFIPVLRLRSLGDMMSHLH